MSETSNAIERALTILETVAHSERGLTNSELSRRLKIPKSSASYILGTLEKTGYLMRERESGKYRLGLKLMGLTREMLSHIDVREIARPVLEKFVKKTNLSAHLAVLDNGRAVYVEKIEAAGFVKMDIWVGHRLPVHSTAIGKVLVAGLPEDEIIGILKLRGMEKKSPKTITNPARFLKEIKKVRDFGFAIDNEENSTGVRCVAAPIFDAEGRTVAALGTSSTITEINEAALPRIVEMICHSAGKVSQYMGFSGKLPKYA
ncbi:MAG: IclR family transcriptional regulator [Pyrinomonadaceae bacterium]